MAGTPAGMVTARRASVSLFAWRRAVLGAGITTKARDTGTDIPVMVLELAAVTGVLAVTAATVLAEAPIASRVAVVVVVITGTSGILAMVVVIAESVVAAVVGFEPFRST